MKKQPARDILKTNLDKLAAAARQTRSGWATARNIDPKKLDRALKQKDLALVRTVQFIADKAKMEVWQLLHPDLDAAVVGRLSPQALDVAEALDRIPPGPTFDRAYALMIQVAEFGNIPESPGEPAPSTAPTAAPARAK